MRHLALVTTASLLAVVATPAAAQEKPNPEVGRHHFLATKTANPVVRHTALTFVRANAEQQDLTQLSFALRRAEHGAAAHGLLDVIGQFDGQNWRQVAVRALTQGVGHAAPGVSTKSVRLLEHLGDRDWVSALLNAVANPSLSQEARLDMLGPFLLLRDHRPLDQLATLLDADDVGDALRAGIIDLLARSRFRGRYTAKLRGTEALQHAGASAVLASRFARGDREALDVVWAEHKAGKRSEASLQELITRAAGLTGERWFRFVSDVYSGSKSPDLNRVCCERLRGARNAAVRQLLEKAAIAGDAAVRTAAVVTLAQSGAAELVEFWPKVLESDSASIFDRLAAAAALLQADDRRGLPFVIGAATHKDDDVRIVAGTILAAHGDLSAIPALIDAIGDANHAVRAAGERGFRKVLWAFRPYARPFSDPRVRAARRTKDTLPAALHEWWANQPVVKKK